MGLTYTTAAQRDVQRTQRVNVGAIIYFVRQDAVAPAMSWQKIDLTPG